MTQMINGPKDYTIRIYINPRKNWEGIKKALHQIRCLMQGFTWFTQTSELTGKLRSRRHQSRNHIPQKH
jgi:hypothetical protein